MGVHIDDAAALARGFHRRLSALSSDAMFELADILGIDHSDAPESDHYDWVRQRIYDELQREGTTD